jgi:hypothetical protein
MATRLSTLTVLVSLDIHFTCSARVVSVESMVVEACRYMSEWPNVVYNGLERKVVIFSVWFKLIVYCDCSSAIHAIIDDDSVTRVLLCWLGRGGSDDVGDAAAAFTESRYKAHACDGKMAGMMGIVLIP